MNVEVCVATLAVVISLVASAVTIVQTRQMERTGKMPILVFIYDGKVERWFIRNVGFGPALNIIIAQQCEDGDEDWYQPGGDSSCQCWGAVGAGVAGAARVDPPQIWLILLSYVHGTTLAPDTRQIGRPAPV